MVFIPIPHFIVNELVCKIHLLNHFIVVALQFYFESRYNLTDSQKFDTPNVIRFDLIGPRTII